MLHLPRIILGNTQRNQSNLQGRNQCTTQVKKYEQSFRKHKHLCSSQEQKEHKKSCGKNKNIGNKQQSRKFLYTPRTSDTNHYCL